MDKSIQKTTLYRYFNSDDRLLYVGITGDNTKRQSQHKRNSFWFGEIAKATFQHFDNRGEAAQAEVTAIQNEQPLYNTQHLHSKKIEWNPIELGAKYHLLSMLHGFDINKVPIKIDVHHTEFKNCLDVFELQSDSFTMDELIAMQLEHLVWRETIGELELPNLDSCDLCVNLFNSNWFGQTLQSIDIKTEQSRRAFLNAAN